ncbi:MAG: sugar-binding domain-containing protein, partial [Planctomycetota bacterium]
MIDVRASQPRSATSGVAQLVLATLLVGLAARGSDGREVSELRDGWRFRLGPVEGGESTTLGDADWTSVRVPHDWAIAGPFDQALPGDTGKLPWRGEGWYRKRFQVPSGKDGPADAAGKRVYLLFDGVMAEPTVWVNGERAGGWDYGYNSFWVDATPHVRAGASNLIAVHADTRRHGSRWYPGAGIYRKVTMHVTEPVHVARWGLRVETPAVEPKVATAVVRCRVENRDSQPRDATITLSIA